MRIISASLLLVILTLVSDSFCFDFKCTEAITLSDTCFALHLVVTSPNEIVTSVNGNNEPTAVLQIEIKDEVMHFVPKRFGPFFKNVEHLDISNSKLEYLEQPDLIDMAKLKSIVLEGNNLEILEEGVFDFQPDLEIINIRKNRLKFVHKDIFYGFPKLRSIYLEDNPCTNSMLNEYGNYFKGQAFNYEDTVVEALNYYCQSWYNVLFFYEQRFNVKIKNMQLENEKLSRQVKMCDGNLDAALSNFQPQKILTSNMVLMDKPNDTPVIDLMCEHDKCVAREFKVSYSNLPIEKIYMYIYAHYNDQAPTRSFEIHQQQTLFLPQHFGQHLAQQFPQLINLSVTESGLCEIEHSVFGELNLLSLNVTRNKIPEVPVGTFSGLNKLQILDLSYNKIRSLPNDVFANLQSLQQLYLNNNYLTSIRVEVVRNLESLTSLFLQGNRLKFISATVLTPFVSLESIDLSDNLCINLSHPNSTLIDIETTIIDACIAPVEFYCQSDLIEANENIVENKFYCNVEDLFIESPKTKISMPGNRDRALNKDIKAFFADRQSIRFFPFQLSQHFPNLERINIQRSNLTSLHRTDFDGFSKLTDIVINHNNLSLINDGTFDTIPQLELLNLSSNAITALPINIFAKLTRLHTLILSDNRIVRFSANFLPRKNAIEVFRVDNNELEFIETKTVRFLRRANLIDLSGNVCIDMQFVKTENGTRALVELSGEIDLNCSNDD